MDWYIGVLKQYAVFTGRSRRTEYWMFVLFSIIVSAILGAIDRVLFERGILGIIYSLAVFLPALGVSIRRLHDTDRSGWWVLIGLIPLIGFIVLLVFMVQEGQPGANRFGPSPKSA